MIELTFIPLNKYDTVIEHFDGSITIPKHEKKRYLFNSNIHDTNVFFLNNITGSIFQYSLKTKSLIQINIHDRQTWKNCIGIAYADNYLISYHTQYKEFIFLNLNTFTIEKQLPYIDNINNFYISYPFIWIFNRENASISKYKLEENSLSFCHKFYVKGIGNASLLVANDSLYITDSEENILRQYTFNGKLLFEAITPFIDPIGQIFYENQHYILYGGLVNEVGYDNRCWQEQKPFLHRINIRIEEDETYIKSFTNTFEVELYYEETFFEDALLSIKPIDIDLRLPINTIHQKVLEIQPLGIKPILDNNKLSSPFYRYKINGIDTQSIGYRALLQLQSVKHTIKNIESFFLSTKNLLTDIEKQDLDCYHPFFEQFIIKDKITDLEKLLLLRNLIYQRLEYKKNIYARDFIDIWKDGYGTCGDYASLMLIFFHINNISCQSVSGYKIPRFYNASSGIISVYYNHTWLEVFDHTGYPLPLESSSDDKSFHDRFCEGQFLGIDWTHIKLYNGKAYPNLINVASHPNIHPFDLLKKASVFVIIKREIL
ncbi:MAG: transglutaminase domain-containing protein [Bacteroidales bacterium]|nr:transglutaminase domain-containing protein [Bacteroidales bacterium]